MEMTVRTWSLVSLGLYTVFPALHCGLQEASQCLHHSKLLTMQPVSIKKESGKQSTAACTIVLKPLFKSIRNRVGWNQLLAPVYT